MGLTAGDERGRWAGGLLQVHLIGWKIHHTFESGMWIAQESLTLIDCQFSDHRKAVVFANHPTFWGTTKEVRNNLWVGRSRNPGARHWMSDKVMKGLTELDLKNTKMDKDKPLPMPKPHTMFGIFCHNDILRDSSGNHGVNNRGLMIYDTSTMPMIIEGNRFYDFITHNTFTAAIDLANTNYSKAMVAKMCFMLDNHYFNTPIRMNFARINQTLAHADKGTPYNSFGLNMETSDGKKNYDWQSPARRIFSEGEIALGCNDLDGSTVGKKGQFMINQLKKSDLIDGPDCFVDRIMNANVCPMESQYSSLAVNVRGRKADWKSDNHHWLIQKHHIIENNQSDWITYVTKELGDEKSQNQNLITFQANNTYLITSPPGFGLHSIYEMNLLNAEQFDWIHIAYCLKGGTPDNIKVQHTFQNNDPLGSSKTKDEKEYLKEFPHMNPLQEVESIVELKESDDTSWFFDEENSWLHFKLFEKADRKLAGTVHANLIKENESYSYNSSEYYPCSPEYGCLRFQWNLDPSTVNNEFECPIFPLDVTEGSLLYKSANFTLFLERIELCSECKYHSDCGVWELNHMKCRQGRCVCGDNWLPHSGSSHCRKLNTYPAASYEQFTPEMCDNYITCDQQLEICLEECYADQGDQNCSQKCFRDHAVCENS